MPPQSKMTTKPLETCIYASRLQASIFCLHALHFWSPIKKYLSFTSTNNLLHQPTTFYINQQPFFSNNLNMIKWFFNNTLRMRRPFCGPTALHPPLSLTWVLAFIRGCFNIYLFFIYIREGEKGVLM